MFLMPMKLVFIELYRHYNKGILSWVTNLPFKNFEEFPY